jgi:hypothetical protein
VGYVAPLGVSARRLALPLSLFVYALAAAGYFVARFAGNWAENDSAVQAEVIRSTVRSGELVPLRGTVYVAGYSYAAISHALLATTGIDVATLQQIVYPLVTPLLLVPIWLLYRELTGNTRAAAIASLLLLTQPEFLFVVFRGSHERVLRAMLAVLLWLLVKSFHVHQQPSRFAVCVLLFYVAAFGFIATNTLFGVSLVVAIITALVLARLLGGAGSQLLTVAASTAQRLTLVATAITALTFILVFYVYPPAVRGLEAIRDVGRRTVELVLTTSAGDDPYAQVAGAWTDLPTYFLLSASNYLLIAASAPIWLYQGVRWLRGTAHSPTLNAWLLWLLYAAFATQGALAILSDRSGLLGSNLQHRSFPSFAMTATPLIAVALARLRPRPTIRAAAALAFGLLSALALLKLTNEPGLSNKWTYYTRAELRALTWVRPRERGAVWIGPDERLDAAYSLVIGDPRRQPDPRAQAAWDIYAPDPRTRLFLVSDVIRAHSQRLRVPLPVAEDENRVYDSGAVQLYRLRPRTQFQQ